MISFFKKKNKLSMKKDKDSANTTTNPNDVRNTLREGDEGEDVKQLQKMILGVSHICPNIVLKKSNGIYDANTKSSIESFQNMMGINRTGIVDKITYDRLKLIYSKKDEIKAVEKINFNTLNSEIIKNN